MVGMNPRGFLKSWPTYRLRLTPCCDNMPFIQATIQILMHCMFKQQMRHVLVLAKQMRSLCKMINQMTNNSRTTCFSYRFSPTVYYGKIHTE